MQVGARSQFYFDRQVVIDAVGKAQAKALGHDGNLVKKIMQRSMRYRKKASPRGTPPSAHKEGRGPLLRKLSDAAWDHSAQSVVIGPWKLAGASSEVPKIQNEGGTVRIRVADKKPGKKAKTKAQAEAYKRGLKSGRIQRPPRVTKTIRLAARPYSVPALEAAKPKLMGPWADSVKP